MKYETPVIFVKTRSTGYQGARSVISQVEVLTLWLENTGLQKSSFSEDKKTDAKCFPDPQSEFIQAWIDDLEGIYIIFKSEWYKIISNTISRDHLLTNTIDNIELKLSRSEPVAQIS